MIRVGQVTGAHGTEGAVKVMPLTDFDDRFAPGSSLVLEGQERRVQWSRPGQPGLVVKLVGIESRAVAELFRGRYLEVPEASMRVLEAGRFYHHQVVGLAAVTSSGRPLGTITEVLYVGQPTWDVGETTLRGSADAVAERLDVDFRRCWHGCGSSLQGGDDARPGGKAGGAPKRTVAVRETPPRPGAYFTVSSLGT